MLLLGSITNTYRTVNGTLGCWSLGTSSWYPSMPYCRATLRSGSAMMGNCTSTLFTSLMSLIQPSCDALSLHDSPITLTDRLANSGAYLATVPSSVVQTGVKSAGCEKSTPQESPSQS